MRLILHTVALISMLLCATPVLSNEGAVDIDNLGMRYGSPKVNLNLNTELIMMAALLKGNRDPELTDVLSKLELVKIRVYDTKGENTDARNVIDKQSKALAERKWHAVIDREQEGKLTRVFTRSKDQLLAGILVMTLEDAAHESELSFVNIIGEISPSQVRKVAETLNFGLGL